MSERDFELATMRADQERDAGVEAASAAVSGHGREFCSCGEVISDYRREKFGATRCIECQRTYEQETHQR